MKKAEKLYKTCVALASDVIAILAVVAEVDGWSGSKVNDCSGSR